MQKDEMKELIEKMANRVDICGRHYIAEKMLSVVLQDIKERPWKFVQKCVRCSGGVDTFIASGDDDNPIYTKVCPNCKGSGVMAVEQDGL